VKEQIALTNTGEKAMQKKENKNEVSFESRGRIED